MMMRIAGYLATLAAVLLIVFIAATSAGCASVIAPDNEIRITEYGTQGTVVGAFTGEVGGCRVTQAGKVDAEITYKGERCEVRHAVANKPE